VIDGDVAVEKSRMNNLSIEDRRRLDDFFEFICGVGAEPIPVHYVRRRKYVYCTTERRTGIPTGTSSTVYGTS
jgi:hypothetical protein